MNDVERSRRLETTSADPQTKSFDRAILLIDIVRHVASRALEIVIFFAGVNFALAVIGFVEGSIVFGVVNSVLAAMGANFAVFLLKRPKEAARQLPSSY